MIDYGLLQESISYYHGYGYERIEVPWMVSEYINNLTKPSHIPSFKIEHNGKCLVGSGEQSFLYQYLKGYLPKGKFQTVTPCFRYDSFDALHGNTFMKNELIRTDVVDLVALDKIVDQALGFYRQYIPNSYAVETSEGFDIEIDGKELGSYGIRSSEFLDWIYATGCAEPRTSKLIEQYG